MTNTIRFSICFFLTLQSQFCVAQFSHDDTLRGTNGPDRSWWDVQHYDIALTPNINDKTVDGKVEILFTTKSSGDKTMQIDLQEPMIIDKITFQNANVQFNKTGINTWSVYLKNIEPGMYMDHRDGGNGWTIKQQTLTISYHGRPRVALNPPWDGGFIWTKDQKNRPWVTITCQGFGASVWYPCKDYQGDEPDNGASLTINVPDTLIAISNGRAIKKTHVDFTHQVSYKWEVKNPINNYNIIPYIGKYVNFREVYKGEKGDLTMNYWVLDYNFEKAKKQFTQAPKMMKAFEYWFGPYPFYEDGYKLVEAPHLGMEHQSAIAYGNKFANGCYGRGDLSYTGWGLKWDYIIVHESGHEWFGNNISTTDIADMWVHEGFATYSESLFTEYYYGKKAGSEYVIGLRKAIKNDVPVIAPYGVNTKGSTDMYYKGANLLHTIRQVINDDEKFRMLLRGLNAHFYHQTVSSKQVEDYISKHSGLDLTKVFDQYLRTTMVPTLEYKITGNTLTYRWANVVKGFNMPVKINDSEQHWIQPLEEWKSLELPPGSKKGVSVDNNFYINTKKVN